MSLSVLILKPEWLNAILDKGKRMEIRGMKTTKIGHRIGLMASKTDQIVGMATITECIGPMSLEQFASYKDMHHCTAGLPYKTTYGWVLTDVQRLDTPIYHKRKKGVIIFSTFTPPMDFCSSPVTNVQNSP